MSDEPYAQPKIPQNMREMHDLYVALEKRIVKLEGRELSICEVLREGLQPKSESMATLTISSPEEPTDEARAAHAETIPQAGDSLLPKPEGPEEHGETGTPQITIREVMESKMKFRKEMGHFPERVLVHPSTIARISALAVPVSVVNGEAFGQIPIRPTTLCGVPLEQSTNVEEGVLSWQ